LLVLSGAVVSAQTRKGPPQAVRFDQFGQVGHCDVTARLDNFAIQLQYESSARGAVISYAPEGDGPGTGKQVLEMIKDYIVNTRGLAEDRIETIYGGRNSDKHHSQTELWIVPNGASLPKTVKHESNIETFRVFSMSDLHPTISALSTRTKWDRASAIRASLRLPTCCTSKRMRSGMS
jgi:hypothetical protein